MDYLQELTGRFPVRKTKAQKQAFRAWALEEMRRLGYKAKVEDNGRAKRQNIVVGDPGRAAVLFTSHYDTGARMPLPDLIIPRSLPVFAAYQLLNILLLFVPALAALILVQGFTGMPRLALGAFALMFIALLLLVTRGPACLHNANSGDSGVAALLALMAAIPEAERGKVAFTLFDGRFNGRAGSKAYARDHMQVQFTRLTVNMDCVGVGEHMLCVSTDVARKCTGYGSLERALADTAGCTAHFFGSRTTILGGDQKSFKCGVALVACKQATGIGFVTPSLRTARDRVARPENIDYLARALSGYIHAILGKKDAEPEQN